MKKSFFRAFMLAGFLFAGAFTLSAQSYVSSNQALTLLKTEILSVEQSYNAYINSANTKTSPQAKEMQSQIEMFNQTYDYIREGYSVEQAILLVASQSDNLVYGSTSSEHVAATNTTTKGGNSGDTPVDSLVDLLSN